MCDHSTIFKVCRRCHNLTPFDQLIKNKKCSHGVDALCLACRKIQQKERREQPGYKERQKRLSDEWYQKNKEIVKQRSREYRHEHRDEIRERRRESTRAYRKANNDKRTEYNRQWRSEHRTHTRERDRKWRQRNIDRARSYGIHRYAREKNAPGNYDASDIRRIFDEQTGLCAYCKRDLIETGYHVDHITPLTKGGTNYPDNLCLSCPKCNVNKNARTPEQWTNRWYEK